MENLNKEELIQTVGGSELSAFITKIIGWFLGADASTQTYHATNGGMVVGVIGVK